MQAGLLPQTQQILGQMEINISKGGWSGGGYLEKKSNAIIKFIAKITNNNLPIIGVGGVCDADTAIHRIQI